MKRKGFLLGIITLLFALIFTFAFKTEVIAARNSKSVNGLYMKVKDNNPIAVGDKVIIASTNRHLLSAVGGNPAYLVGSDEGFYMSYTTQNGHMQDSDDRIYLNNSHAIEFEICAGSLANTYAFKANLDDDFGEVYLSYNEGYNSSYYHFPGIAYWVNSTGVDKGDLNNNPKGTESWNVTYDTTYGVSRITYGNKSIGFRPASGNSRKWFALGEEIAINIYKKVEDGLVINNINGPTSATYNPGEMVNLSGLEFDITYGNRTERIRYIDEPATFHYSPIINGVGNVIITIEYLGVKFNINLNVNNKVYTNIDRPLDNYSGIYILVSNGINNFYVPDLEDIDDDFTIDTLNINNLYDEADKYVGKLEYSDGSETYNEDFDSSALLTVIGINDVISQNETKYNYYLLNSDGKYLRPSNDDYVNAYGSKGDSVEFVVIDGATYIKLEGTNKILSLMSDKLKYVEYNGSIDSNALRLFSAAYNDDVIEEIDTFKNKLKAGITLATLPNDISAHRYINSTAWADAEAYYNHELSAAAKYYISKTNYIHNNELEDTLEDIMDLYDYTHAKAANNQYFNDFLNRRQTIGYVACIEGIINEIYYVSLDMENAILQARNIYNESNSVIQGMVNNYDKLVEAETELAKYKIVIPLQQEAIEGEYTYVRFIFIIKDINANSADLENKLTLILDDGDQILYRDANVYRRLTSNDETYIAQVNNVSYSFDNDINNEDLYVVYVVKFTTSKYDGHNIKASLKYNDIEFETSGYTFGNGVH